MKKSIEIMLRLIRAEVCGEAEVQQDLPPISADELKEIYRLSKKHDLSHIVGGALEDKELLRDGDEVSEAFKNSAFRAIWRYERQKFELEKACSALEKAKIRHLPLKGSVIRDFYSKPWLRTSCDIDILVSEEDLMKGVEAINADGSYKVGHKDSHDIGITSASGEHIELHYDLVEDGIVADSARILRRVWERCSPEAGWEYRMRADDELFYFYHIAHMAKHFHNGGCGIRPLLDVWVLEHVVPHDRAARDALLADAGLLTFADKARELSEFWFSDAESDELIEKMAEYIVNGGVYGNQTNRVTVQKAEKKDNKFKYVLSRVFEKYDVLKFRYPILQKHRWLMPIMQVHRWFNLLNRDKAKRALSEMQTLTTVETDGITDFLTEIGL